MLKQIMDNDYAGAEVPAAFGRLCVETDGVSVINAAIAQPPSGGCVLKHKTYRADRFFRPSRLRAAVC